MKIRLLISVFLSVLIIPLAQATNKEMADSSASHAEATEALTSFELNGSPAPSTEEITRNIIRVAQKYNEAIACVEQKVSPKDIAALKPWKNFFDRDDAEYAVILGGDVGCRGGSGTFINYLIIVKIGAGNNFYVDVENELPLFDLPSRFVTRLVGNTEDTIIFDGLTHRDGDSNNFPTQKVRFTLKKDDGKYPGEKKGWKLIEEKTMGIETYH